MASGVGWFRSESGPVMGSIIRESAFFVFQFLIEDLARLVEERVGMKRLLQELHRLAEPGQLGGFNVGVTRDKQDAHLRTMIGEAPGQFRPAETGHGHVSHEQVDLAAMFFRQLKRILDPNLILNPGKMFDA